jgi:hypothetical protein
MITMCCTTGISAKAGEVAIAERRTVAAVMRGAARGRTDAFPETLAAALDRVRIRHSHSPRRRVDRP